MTTIAFFTRLLDEATPGERYRLAREQIMHAERNGFERAWVAQHHFHEAEGGLPAPLVFLAHVAAHTRAIRLGTGVITLPLEDPVRVAEDATVADLLSQGRIDLGFGNGGTPSSFAPFGRTFENKNTLYDRGLDTVMRALRGGDLGADNTLYPAANTLASRVWQATFSISGGERAGRYGHGLLLSRTQPRSAEQRSVPLHDIQLPIVDAYLAALPSGSAPSITASRTVFVADSRAEALCFAERGLRRIATHFGGSPDSPIEELIRLTDTHVGTPDDIVESLATDLTLQHATEIAIQVHSVDAPHLHVLRSLELFAHEVAPRFGWGTHLDASPDRSASPDQTAHQTGVPA